MHVTQGITALTTALLHPSAVDAGPARDRHQVFLLRMLGLVFVALAAAPFFLAFHGAPTLGETLVFSLCLAPLGAVMLVSKTGALAAGHFVGALCLVGIGATLAVSHEAGLGAALAWIIAAQVEGMLALDRRVVVASALAGAVTFAALAAVALSGWLGPVPVAGPGDLLAGLALAYAVAAGVAATHLRARWRLAEDRLDAHARAIADTVDDLVVAFDGDGTVTFIGEDCERHLNIAARDLMGRGLFGLIHVGDRPLFLKTIADAAHGAEMVTALFRLRNVAAEPRHDGGFDTTFPWIEMRARRQARGGAPARVMSLLRNVTASKHAMNDIEAARQSAEAASRSRDHFLANMSHELRTPLNAIIGFSEILGNIELRPADEAKQTEYARIIHQSGQHLLAVVNSILDMAKLQSGTFSIIPETFDIGPLIDSCCEIVTLKAREGRIEIVRADTRGIEPVVGDRRACKQILINLLSNAIKFTPENGRVTIGARPEGNSLVVTVTDTGIGIGAADLVRLGDPFFQAKSALDRPYEGTGLGLSVVRGLVGLHGGSIAIESEPGHGTAVTIRLPLDCRFAGQGDPSAKIETIARHRAVDRFAPVSHSQLASPSQLASQSQDTMVKKSA